MEEKTENEISIFAGKRAWYELLLASVFFGAFIYMILLFVYFAFIEVSVKIAIRAFVVFLLCGTYCLVYGFKFSATKNMLVNLKTNTIISRYIVGPFSYDVKLKATEFEYVSFFEDRYGEFGTKLWYVKNRHYEMYSFEDKESAFQFSLNLSNKLNIDLLDATEKGNFKWVEKEKYNKL
ncbi:hypothetical protein [Flavobacterium sharifuzzamanii]|uniref:hypothetical protein n=1 Tax=Flavobacterium sharifuzzamanii TaxID=2211133 RepID=UPI000DAC9B47|nr:hypothetical protein [Flavobacterium sharifuzzamanii]KAF2080437.1 hypothetical protein DMA14_14170 [Flavobacterium sharifuzzamanii]